MPVYSSIQSVAISSGTATSAQFESRRNREIGLFVPALQACSLHVQGAVLSGTNFRRVLTAAADAEYAAAVGSGSVCITLGEEIIAPWNFLRIETSSAQGDNRHFQVVSKL